jgi:hypothetical protein
VHFGEWRAIEIRNSTGATVLAIVAYCLHANAFTLGIPLRRKNAMGHSNFNSKRAPVAIAFLAGIASAFAVLSGEAVAAPLSAVSNITNNTYIDSATSGNFDISGSLAGSTVVSGTVTANFRDNSDEWVYSYFPAREWPYLFKTEERATGQIVNGLYMCGAGYCFGPHPAMVTDKYFATNATYDAQNPIESATLTVGSNEGAAASLFFDQGTESGSQFVWVNSYSYYDEEGWGLVHNYDNYFYHYSGYSGSFSITLSLDTLALADLNADGILGFGLSNVFGNFVVSDITLNADLVAAPVPEPETYAMMLAGLGLLGVVARRRKQQQASA